jgi:hypothetical protein
VSEVQNGSDYYYTVADPRRLVNELQRGILITICLYLLGAVAVSLIFLHGQGLWGMVIFAVLAVLGVLSVCARARIQIANDTAAAMLQEMKDAPGLPETEQKTNPQDDRTNRAI